MGRAAAQDAETTQTTRISRAKRTRWGWVWVALALLLVCIPRFNRHDWGWLGQLTGKGAPLGGGQGDADHYIVYVSYFRGQADYEELNVPFAYRPLVPWVSALLPFDAMTSINLVNLAALFAGAMFLQRLAALLGFTAREALLGSFMFVVSFPVFYYGTIGLVDPVLIFFLTLGLYFLFKRRWAWLLLVLGMSCLVKEMMVMLVPVVIARLATGREPWKLKAALLVVASLLPLVVIRLVVKDLTGANYLKISIKSFLSNLRLRALASVLLTFGLPGALSVIFFLRRPMLASLNRAASLSLLITLGGGILLSVALSVYSMFSAHTDGRFMWASYPFSILLALLALRPRASWWKGLNL